MGYDPNLFVKPLGDFWTCPKCDLILREPVQICENSHSICSSCSSSSVFQICPSTGCNGAVLDEKSRRLDATTSRFLSSQSIRCANSTQRSQETGEVCDWIGPLIEGNTHAIECTFSTTACPHTGCNFRARSSALPTHLRMCPFRLVRCPNGSVNIGGGSPRRGCNYKGGLNTMDQHLSGCEYSPCPQASYGCRFVSTPAMMEVHDPECKDLLLSELRELRKQLASQGVSAQSAPPLTTGPVESGDSIQTGGENQRPNQESRATLLMTPPSTEFPSSDHEPSTNNPFGATVIHEDESFRQRSSSILDLDQPMEAMTTSDQSRQILSDDEMEEGEIYVHDEGSTLLVEAASNSEEQDANDDATAEYDVLKAVGIKLESDDTGSITQEVYPQVPSEAGGVRPRPSRKDNIASITEPKSSPSAHTATSKYPSERNASIQGPNNPGKSTGNRVTHRPGVKSTKAGLNHHASFQRPKILLNAKPKQPGGVPRPFPPITPEHPIQADASSNGRASYPAVPMASSSEAPNRDDQPVQQGEALVRNPGSRQPGHNADIFGPIRNNMHRRNHAISHSRGSHPYANGIRRPNAIVPPEFPGFHHPLHAYPWNSLVPGPQIGPYPNYHPSGQHPGNGLHLLIHLSSLTGSLRILTEALHFILRSILRLILLLVLLLVQTSAHMVILLGHRRILSWRGTKHRGATMLMTRRLRVAHPSPPIIPKPTTTKAKRR